MDLVVWSMTQPLYEQCSCSCAVSRMGMLAARKELLWAMVADIGA